MDQVEFEPAQQWSAKILKADDCQSEKNSLSRFVIDVLFEMGILNSAYCVLLLLCDFYDLDETDLIALQFFIFDLTVRYSSHLSSLDPVAEFTTIFIN